MTVLENLNLHSTYFKYIFFITLIWVVLFIAYTIIVHLINSKRTDDNKLILYNGMFLPTVGFSILGLAIGILTGLSRTPVVDITIPALLTFLAGFVTYVFITPKYNFENRLMASLAIFSMAFFLLYGSDKGADARVEYEIYENEYILWKELYVDSVKTARTIELNKLKETNYDSK